MKTRRETRKSTLNRMAAGALAGVMLVGNYGVALAADADALRTEAQRAFEASDYKTAGEVYGELIESGEATAADFWYAGKCEEGLNFHYRANELYDRAYMIMEEGNRPEAVYQQKIRSMYNAREYWYVEKYYNEALQLGLADNYIASYYGDALLNCKQYERAVSVYQSILSHYTGDDSGKAPYMRAIGDCYKNMGMTEEAAQAYGEMYAFSGDTEKYCEKMAALKLEYELDSVETIVADYMSESSYEEIADTLSDYDYFEEALDYYELAENEENADLRSSKADTYYSMGLAKEAAALFEEILAENPEDTAVMNKLGAIYCDALGRYEEAKELFDKVVALHPDANGSKGNLAVVARKSGNLEEVSDLYREVIEMDDTYLSAYNYEIMYRKDITAEEAIEILSGYPGWPETEEMQALLLGDTINTSYMTRTTLESYLAYFRERLEEDGSNYYYLSTIGSLLRGLGRCEEALPFYEEALKQTEMMAYYATNGLGNCYYENQNYDLAAEQYGKNAGEAHTKSSILSVAECYIAMGQYDRAKAEIESYLSEGGLDDVSYYYMLIAYQEEDYEALLSYAEQYLKETPDSLKAKAYKAAALKALGKEGADAVIADIDSIRYAYENTDVLIAESILGRFDKAREIYQFLLNNYPGDAREILHDYEIRNLLTDEMFCEMAGLEVPDRSSVEEQAEGGKVTTGQTTEEKNDDVPEEKNEEIPGKESEGNAIPVAVGSGIAAVLVGVVAVLVSKRKKVQKKKQ